MQYVRRAVVALLCLSWAMIAQADELALDDPAALDAVHPVTVPPGSPIGFDAE